jgi:prolyl 4-hydroxylase
MGVEIKDLIQVYSNALDEETCKSLIDIFENNEDKHERIERNRRPNFTQFNLTQYSEDNKEIHNLIISKTLQYKKEYYEFVDGRCFPKENAFEQFRIKKYNNDGNDAFDAHVDVIDYASSRRFLSFFWYLNAVEEGGETVFSDVTIKPETGKLVVFPPLWMFPHQGNSPISNEKYLLSTYLHYK